ncbi:hypothetical protein DFJ43DRAFT_443412 [Lentinula guzmanii]|uniref:Uncharacterized protein n=1 Tax=Lentinula guzmanii TaxID=2804957 RepID=A0AA38JI03_9AGAR|nr:hypothetical protein DFJ43DRAFT_443412 [Lentinula guzmanii]
MLFTVTTSHLFTLLYLCVSMLTGSGSPLPAANDRPVIPLPANDRPVIHFGPEPGYRRNVELGHFCLGDLAVLHTALAIGDTLLYPTWTDKSRTQLFHVDVNLTQHVRNEYEWVPLGKANFTDRGDEEAALNTLLRIELPPFKERGGTDWDYIESALNILTKRDELLDPRSVLQEFQYDKRRHCIVN